MIPIDIPHVQIVEIVTCPINDMWNGFDLTYHGLLSIFKRLEEGMEIEQEFDENQIRQLRDAVVKLAQIGSLHASPEETQLLRREIIPLFINEAIFDLEDLKQIAFDPLDTWSIPYFLYGITNETCSFKKTIRHIAHKIAKFIKKHKKEILIGTATAVGVAVAAKTISSIHEKRHRRYLPPPPPPAPVMHFAPASEDEEDNEDFEDLVDATFDFDESEVPLLVVIENPARNIPDQKIIEFAKSLGAEASHEVWEHIAETAPFVLIAPIGFDTWTHQVVPKVHETIDELFDQDISFEEKKKAASRFTIGAPPPPLAIGKLANEFQKVIRATGEGFTAVEKLFLARKSAAASEVLLLEKSVLNNISPSSVVTTKEGGKVARVAEKCFGLAEEPSLAQTSAAAAEVVLLEKSVLSDIRIQPDGIWEIDGKNIKRFNSKKMLATNRVDHIFGNSEHHLERLELTPIATYEKVTEAIILADRAGKIPANKPFEILIYVNDYEIVVRGKVIEGELNYSTFFIPKKM